MPQQQQEGGGQAAKKKKKGRVPAHQNSFAFRHNPKSKKTQRILEAPVRHVCRRCRDKLEWRKKYRKYKPRTGLAGKCNACQKRNAVTAAYHTICESCTRTSPKALALLREWNATRRCEELEEELHRDEEPLDQQQIDDDARGAKGEDRRRGSETGEDRQRVAALERQQHQQPRQPFAVYRRICAVCTKEPALLSLDGEEEDGTVEGGLFEDHRQQRGGDDDDGRRPLRLRKLKTLERQQREQQEGKAAEAAGRRRSQPTAGRGEGRVRDDVGYCHSNNSNDDGEDDDDSVNGGVDDIEEGDGGGDDDDDPFLAAVGGADKLLVGEAYQRQVLAAKQQRQQQLGDRLE